MMIIMKTHVWTILESTGIIHSLRFSSFTCVQRCVAVISGVISSLAPCATYQCATQSAICKDGALCWLVSQLVIVKNRMIHNDCERMQAMNDCTVHPVSSICLSIISPGYVCQLETWGKESHLGNNPSCTMGALQKV